MLSLFCPWSLQPSCMKLPFRISPSVGALLVASAVAAQAPSGRSASSAAFAAWLMLFAARLVALAVVLVTLDMVLVRWRGLPKCPAVGEDGSSIGAMTSVCEQSNRQSLISPGCSSDRYRSDLLSNTLRVGLFAPADNRIRSGKRSLLARTPILRLIAKIQDSASLEQSTCLSEGLMFFHRPLDVL